MITIRPHRLFNLIETPNYSDRSIQIVLPDQNTPVTFDTVILLALAKLVQPRTIFEFGTFFGVQTFNLARNMPETKLFTLDLENLSQSQAIENDQDRFVSMTGVQGRSRLAFLGTPAEKRITRLFGDSNHFDFSKFTNQMDLVYVDGGHDFRTVKSDSENALGMRTTGRASCVAWHDYTNPVYPDLTRYLIDLSEGHTMFHIAESWTTFCLAGLPEYMERLRP
jgi:hypothetical protein